MKLLLIVLLAAAADAKARPSSCTVSEWGRWSDWTTGYNRHDVSYRKVADTEKLTTGEINRQHLMNVRVEGHASRQRCLAEGTCPEQDYLPSDGYALCSDGYAGSMDCPCENVDQMSFINFEDMGIIDDTGSFAVEGNDIWGWTSSVTGKEYAIMGTTHATGFVDVTQPDAPVVMGILLRHPGIEPSSWRDIKVIGDAAYVVSEATNSGIQVFDLTRLDSTSSPTEFTEDYYYSDLSNCHNIVANTETKMLYAVGCTENAPNLCDGGLYILDASDPLRPTFVTCYGGDSYVHDTECVVYHGPDREYAGHEICFCYNEDSFTIVDVNEKADIRLLSRTTYKGQAYVHQGCVTPDHTIVLSDDEIDEWRTLDPYTKTYIWDIIDLTNPILRTVYYSTQTSIDHNQYIVGDLTFQANYESGLRILQIDGFNLIPVANFDVKPSRTAPVFFGSWGIYPYFESGTVVVSSIDYGLWILRPDMDAIRGTAAQQKSLISERERFRKVVEVTDLTACPVLSERQTQ